MSAASMIQASRASTPRGELFFWSGLILAGNALAGLASTDIIMRGFAASAADLFGISAIIWMACAASLVLVKNDGAPFSRIDLAVVAMCLVVAILPNASPARFVVTILGGYWLFISVPGSPTRRAGITMLAISGALFWGRFLLAVVGHPMLELDAILTSWLYGLERVGNTLEFTDGTPGGIIIVGGCSSWHGISIALLFWVLLYQWFDIRVRKSSYIWLAVAIAATVLVNNLRLAAMASYPAYFEEIHSGFGATIAAWLTMLLVVGICLFGERREIFAR